jgi:hypothetical protein
MLGALILGAIGGGAAVWFYREQIQGYFDTARDKAADGLEAFEKKTEDVLDRAKPEIVSKLRAGQAAIRRPSGEPGQESSAGSYGQATGTYGQQGGSPRSGSSGGYNQGSSGSGGSSGSSGSTGSSGGSASQGYGQSHS